MHHPNIAQLLDGGTENKTPYLVMEYVEGSRITKFADDRRLSVEGRVRLFLLVCSAVEYAHRAFIVHPDLKPGNILVDATGTPKLLDLGSPSYCTPKRRIRRTRTRRSWQRPITRARNRLWAMR
jgi:serine/threonine protein kinase